MDCTDFLGSYTDYVDGSREDRPLSEHRAHLESCPSCAEYDRVLRKGLRLVRELPRPELTPDFRERLQHRIYHIHDDLSGSRRRVPRVTGVAAVIMAGLLVASTLSVVRHDRVQVELPPVVIEEPERPSSSSTASSTRSAAARSSSAGRVPGVFTGARSGPKLLIVPDIGDEPWLVTPASSQVRLFRAPLQARSRPVVHPSSVSGE